MAQQDESGSHKANCQKAIRSLFKWRHRERGARSGCRRYRSPGATPAENLWWTVDTGDASLVTGVDWTIRADEGSLSQVFENLIRNTVEHGGDGVTVRVGELDDAFYIGDNGPGIPVDERDDVFDAGYSTRDKGTGLGPGIVKQVIDAHDWEINLTEGFAAE